MTSSRILIVDDDPIFRDTYRALLGDAGYSVDVAADRAAALAAIDEDRWDVVILDQKLQGSGGPDSGIDLASEFRTRAPSAKVLIVTAYASDAAIRRAFDAGIFDYVEKTGVLRTLLLARLRHALDLARERRLASLAASEVEAALQATWSAARTETDPNKKGALLEDVVADLLRTIPGFEQVSKTRENEIEEIDVLVRNASTDEFWRKAGQYILVECKHWSKPVGAPEASRFVTKLERRHGRCSLGFFIAMAGFTKPFTTELMVASAKNILVVPLDANDVDALVTANGGRADLLKRLHDRAMVEMTRGS
jgi:CheY-like chemotaxis protein